MTYAEAHQTALTAARSATEAFLAQHGERDACGFAWVTIYGIKLSTRAGKELKALGYSKSEGGGILLWNPSGHRTQNISAKEAGADAYVKVMRAAFPEMKIYANSRLD